MNKYYISFGQIHVHSVNGKTFDKDCLCEIEAETNEGARTKAMDVFKGVFHNCYNEAYIPEIIHFFPRGIIKLRVG